MLIRAVRAEDEGTYQCRAVNEGGTKDGQGLLRIERKCFFLLNISYIPLNIFLIFLKII